ncbi:MAG: N-acetylglucosamine-6-phosphate deacetylase, partial [Oscillospiraceae bacterium]
MLIKNAKVFTAEGVFKKCDLRFGAKIEELGTLPGEGLDASGCYLVPGFVDIHSHGAMDRDFSDGGEGDLEALSHYYASRGVTAFLATTMTLKEPELTSAMARVRDFAPCGAAKCAGVNLEGPFLSLSKRGAQNPDNLHAPDAELFMRLFEASGGRIKLVTVAPEEPGALDFIRRVSKLCTVSVGHSAADYDTALRAFESGATHATHLFNGMPPLHHREPGVIGAAFDAGATAELICDGLHLHPSAVRIAFALFEGRAALISDSLRCAGMPDGGYSLAGLPITLSGGVARLGDGTLAGSAISVLDGVKNARRFGVPLETAIAAATLVPARAIGMADTLGAILPTRPADLLLLDEALNLQSVFIDGKK